MIWDRPRPMKIYKIFLRNYKAAAKKTDSKGLNTVFKLERNTEWKLEFKKTEYEQFADFVERKSELSTSRIFNNYGIVVTTSPAVKSVSRLLI